MSSEPKPLTPEQEELLRDAVDDYYGTTRPIFKAEQLANDYIDEYEITEAQWDAFWKQVDEGGRCVRCGDSNVHDAGLCEDHLIEDDEAAAYNAGIGES